VHKSILENLIDPVSKQSLKLEAGSCDGDEVIEGLLTSESGARYAISKGVPRFVTTQDAHQLQTERSFGYKWHQHSSYDSEEFQAAFRDWMVRRYGFQDLGAMQHYFSRRNRILDAGCGSGFSASLYLTRIEGMWFGVDISDAVDVARERIGAIAGTQFIQADMLDLPFPPGTFDTIFAEGTLHHTPSTERALKSLAPLLAASGEFLFYVYRQKAPVREFTDDYVRNIISPLDPAEAWEQLRPLTQLGQALAELHATIELADDIPILGIKAGRHDVQRLIYWHFAKLFWNDKFSFEENHHINFDWYHPRYAHRQTETEIRRWCDEALLTVKHFDAQDSGFTVRAVKQ
jgi:arsenite methyltransferase